VPLHRDIWWLLGSAVAAIGAAPLIVHGDADVSARRAAAAQRIEQLSPAERQHLEENFKRFEKLSPTEQTHYETLHAKLKQNPHVDAALETFSHWWPTVSAREQAELFKQHDVKQRIAVVGQIQEEVDKERAGRMFFGRSWGRDGFRPLPILPHETFYQIMAELESIASDNLAVQKELPEIQKLDAKGPQRYLKLFTALHQHQQTWSTLVNSPSIENRIVEAISNPQVKDLVRSKIGEKAFGNFGPKGSVVRGMLSMSLGKELYLEAIKQDFGPEFLQKKLDSLSEDEKAELYSYAANDSRIILQMRTFRESKEDSRAAFQPVVEFFQVGGGRSGGRPGDGRPGDGRGGEGRGEGPPRNEGGRGGEGPRRD